MNLEIRDYHKGVVMPNKHIIPIVYHLAVMFVAGVTAV